MNIKLIIAFASILLLLNTCSACGTSTPNNRNHTALSDTSTAKSASKSTEMQNIQQDSVSLRDRVYELHIGESKQLEVSEGAFLSQQNRSVYVKLDPDCFQWESSDSTIVTVDKMGYISGKKAGTAIVTVYVGSASDTCTVTVLDNSVDFHTAKSTNDRPYLFVKNKDRYFPLSSAQLAYGAMERNAWNSSGAGYVSNLDIPELSDNSTLVTFQNTSSYTCYKVKKEITTFPIQIDFRSYYASDDHTKIEQKAEGMHSLYSNFVSPSFLGDPIVEFGSIETINGKTREEYLKTIESNCYNEFIVAKENEEMTIGYYDNTDYLEKTIVANIKY